MNLVQKMLVVVLLVAAATGVAAPAQASSWKNSHRWWRHCTVATHVGAALGYTVVERTRTCGTVTIVLSQKFTPTEEY